MREPEMAEIASLIADALDELKEGSGRNDEIAGRVKQLCDQFPLYEEQLASMRAV
jgi:glycine/serine hydroxymethyltransferase